MQIFKVRKVQLKIFGFFFKAISAKILKKIGLIPILSMRKLDKLYKYTLPTKKRHYERKDKNGTEA